MGNRPLHRSQNDALIEGITTTDVWKQMNQFGAEGTPFLFLSDFKGQQVQLFLLSELQKGGLLYDIEGVTNVRHPQKIDRDWIFERSPMSLQTYKQGFDLVQQHIHAGNSFLVNYTGATPLKTDLSLEEIFYLGDARYKVCVPGQFTFFSPETFIKINDRQIATFPMKGTIDATIADAAALILADHKEMAEHHTIVDLLRNDLSRVARQVTVDRFRYIEEIRTHEKHLLQVSSEITGQLPADWKSQIGTIFQMLLPAGSISGAPKKKTVEIIEAAELDGRGYYTGIVGLFDGTAVNSGVAIRFVEQTDEGMQFRSGGGITCFSEVEKEYQEMIDKVYLPKTHKTTADWTCN